MNGISIIVIGSIKNSFEYWVCSQLVTIKSLETIYSFLRNVRSYFFASMTN